MKTEKRLMRIPVVMICTDYGLKHVTESFAAGALAVLPKPFLAGPIAPDDSDGAGKPAGDACLSNFKESRPAVNRQPFRFLPSGY